jgi:hypothetical protein
MPANESQSLKAGEGGNECETSICAVKILVEKMGSVWGWIRKRVKTIHERVNGSNVPEASEGAGR